MLLISISPVPAKTLQQAERGGAFSLDKPADEAEARSVGAMQVPPGNG